MKRFFKRWPKSLTEFWGSLRADWRQIQWWWKKEKVHPLLAALHQPGAYPHPTGPITLMETHISWVLLTGDYAYKVKKPVDLGFVDFSSLEKRRHFCQEEVRLNQRLAPQLYLDVVEIHGPLETASLQGPGPVIEVAVRMRQFEQSGLLPQALASGALTGEQMENFAARLARFHGSAAVASPEGPYGTAEAVVAPALANLAVLRRLQPELASLAQLESWTRGEAERLNPMFGERLARGRVREGHGDLHLGNLVLHQGAVLGFDCLEFNPGLRWIDVLSDLAFLGMDLQGHGQRVWAGRVLNRWLSVSGDYESLTTWHWYLTYRALVRAKVLALRLEQLPRGEARLHRDLEGQLHSYLHLAQQSCAPSSGGALFLTQGVSGSGKSHLASHLCRRHGWIHLRSDVERRRLFGRWETAVGPVRQGDPYHPSITTELYGRILPCAAESGLRAGIPVVVDATFLKQHQREVFLTLAKRLQVPVWILPCPISLEAARERIRQRQKGGEDPSEADLEVLERQWHVQERLTPEEESHRLAGEGVDALDSLIQSQLTGLFKTTR